MTTLATTLTNVRDALDDTNTALHTDAQLTVWINEACRDIARRCEVLQTTADIVISAGVQQYTAPTDMVRIYRAEFMQTGETARQTLEYRDFNSMDEVWWAAQRQTSGRPGTYTMWGFPPAVMITLYPTPQTAGTLTIFYYKYPTELSAASPSASLTIPMGWEDLIVDYAEYRALRKARDPRWQEAKSIYEEKLAQMYDQSRRWTDSGSQFVSGYGGGHLPSWLVDG